MLDRTLQKERIRKLVFARFSALDKDCNGVLEGEELLETFDWIIKALLPKDCSAVDRCSASTAMTAALLDTMSLDLEAFSGLAENFLYRQSFDAKHLKSIEENIY